MTWKLQSVKLLGGDIAQTEGSRGKHSLFWDLPSDRWPSLFMRTLFKILFDPISWCWILRWSYHIISSFTQTLDKSPLPLFSVSDLLSRAYWRGQSKPARRIELLCLLPFILLWFLKCVLRNDQKWLGCWIWFAWWHAVLLIKKLGLLICVYMDI